MMYKHATNYSFGLTVYHVVTGSRGVIFGIYLTENSMTRYNVVFDLDDKPEELDCRESELCLEQPQFVGT